MALDHSDVIQFESYAAKPKVVGVWFRKLGKFRSLEGSFMECFRLTGGRVEGEHQEAFEPRQVSISWAEPNRINAFHIHPKKRQDELWCVIQGGLLVWLVDLRPDSASRGHRQQVYLAGDEPGLLYIPTGVAHGYRASQAGATLVYATNNQFDWTDPNEGRLPYDYFGEDLWNDNRG